MRPEGQLSAVGSSDSLKRELEAERRRSVELSESLTKAQQELQRTKTVAQSMVQQVEEEEEFITNRMLKRLHELKNDRVALTKEVEAEEDFLVNTLHRRLAHVHREKAELEARLAGEAESANILARRLSQLSGERQRLLKEKADLENVLEAEQEYICNRLNKQVEKLASEKVGLQREKADLQRQVNDLSGAVQRSRQEKVELENALEQEEEAVVNKLQRQLQAVTTAYRALESKMEAYGMSPRDGLPGGAIDATTEWVYGRSLSRGSDRLTGSRRERSLSVSSSSSLRGDHEHQHFHPLLGQNPGGHGQQPQAHHASIPHAAESPRLRRPSAQSSQCSDLANAMNAQTL